MSIDPVESSLATSAVGPAEAEVGPDPAEASAQARATEGRQAHASDIAIPPSQDFASVQGDPEYHKALLAVYHDGQGAIVNGYY
ncbi:MAG: hypothetical protein AB7D57_11860 [Desulfovibrionaceae bacterium]